MGAKASASRPLLFLRRVSMPSARSVPSTVEIAVAKTATIRVFQAARKMSVLASNAPYQRVEKPDQVVGRPLSLKESSTSTAIGR